MQKKGANISLKGYDDIFSTDQSRAEAQQERVQEIPLSELHPFEGHPFCVVDDEEMMKTAKSVRDFGVFTSAHCRQLPTHSRSAYPKKAYSPEECNHSSV